MITRSSIIDAYDFLCKEGRSTPSGAFELMRDAALAVLEEQDGLESLPADLSVQPEISEFKAKAVLSKADGLEVIALHGDGVMISSDNTFPCDFRLNQGSRYQVTLTKLD